jgi:hypothetical protein
MGKAASFVPCPETTIGGPCESEDRWRDANGAITSWTYVNEVGSLTANPRPRSREGTRMRSKKGRQALSDPSLDSIR